MEEKIRAAVSLVEPSRARGLKHLQHGVDSLDERRALTGSRVETRVGRAFDLRRHPVVEPSRARGLKRELEDMNPIAGLSSPHGLAG